jgi:transcriptional regulator with XRE-family HTH domain
MSDQKSEVSEAVRKLRQALGESQQAFAYRMKTAVRTIARWETTRPPKGKNLNDLRELAIENDNPELALVFGDALSHEIGLGAIVTAKITTGLANSFESLANLLDPSLAEETISLESEPVGDEALPSCDLIWELVLEQLRTHSGILSVGAARDAVRKKYPKLYKRAVSELLLQGAKDTHAPNAEGTTDKSPNKRSAKK